MSSFKKIKHQARIIAIDNHNAAPLSNSMSPACLESWFILPPIMIFFSSIPYKALNFATALKYRERSRFARLRRNEDLTDTVIFQHDIPTGFLAPDEKSNVISTELEAVSAALQSIKYSTHDLPVNVRKDWLQVVIGREYANVEITPPSEITLQRQSREPYLFNQDAYFAVVLLSGNYRLQQNGREVFLQPGDISLYDATLAHQICCSHKFSKLIVSISRPLLRDRIAGIDQCTALHIPGNAGIGLVAANFIRSSLNQVKQLTTHEFFSLSEYSLDLLTLALASVRPQNINLSKSHSFTLCRIKEFVAQSRA